MAMGNLPNMLTHVHLIWTNHQSWANHLDLGKDAISVADVYVAYRNVKLDITKLQKIFILHIIYHV